MDASSSIDECTVVGDERDLQKSIPEDRNDHSQQAPSREPSSWTAGLFMHQRRRTRPAADVRNIDELPSGYPRLAAFADSDPNFMVFRRFGYLRCRLLLNQQDVLRDLELRLDKIDRSDARDADGQRRLCCQALDENQTRPGRKQLFARILEEVKIYDGLLSASRSLLQQESPQEDNQSSIASFIWNDGRLTVPDRDYIRHEDDLVALGGDKEYSWVHVLVGETVTRASRRWGKRLFQNNVQAAKSSDPQLAVNLYSKPRIDRIVALLFTIVIIGLIMGPVFVLYRLRKQDGYVQKSVTLGFTTFFALLCSTCTTAKRHEIFAATAAYCAVLVVFTSPSGNTE